MGFFPRGGTGSGAVRAIAKAANVPTAAGVVLTARSALKSAITVGNKTGSANLSVAVVNGNTIQISAAVAIAAGATQTIGFTVTGADGCTQPCSYTLTGTYVIAPITANVAASMVAGTVIAAITGVPIGQVPVLSPADGRFVVAGDEATGWKLARGLSAVSTGSFAGTIGAPGATSGQVALTIVDSIPGTLVSAPAGFDIANIPAGVNVYRYGSGSTSTFGSDFDIASKQPVWDRTLYFDPAGSADADGLTPATPIPSFALGALMSKAFGGNTLWSAKPGVYDRTVVTRTAGAAGTPGLAGNYFKAWRSTNSETYGGISIGLVVNGTGTVISELRYTPTAWTDRTAAGGTNTYSGTYAAGASSVFDFSQTDENGDPVGFAWVPTVADTANPWPEINARWAEVSPHKLGVVYYNGTTVYVRTCDNRAPDANIHVMDGSSRGAGNISAPTGNITYYLDGGPNGKIMFMGGGNAFCARGNALYNANTYTRNVHFLGGHIAAASGHDNPGNAFAHSGGGGEIIHVGSVASYPALDGFNYHGQPGIVAQCPHIVEIACRGVWSGWDGNLANNGSTAHEASRILRIACVYRFNQDRTLHDVHDVHAWMLGVVARPRRLSDGTEQSAAFAAGVAGQNTRTWIDACVVEGSPQFPLEAYAGSILRYANLAFAANDNPGGATGTITAYAA